MEDLEVTGAFWAGKHVFVTGHTGFKGAWLSLWLSGLGARVFGYSLAPPTEPNLFVAARVAERLAASTEADVRDRDALGRALAEAAPEIVVHLAAQALVRRSFREPLETLSTNVLGTAVLLDAAGATRSARVVIVATSDKCYAEAGRHAAHREDDPLGGASPYAASKAAAELVVAAYREARFAPRGVALSSVRAGNVIGGGDWAEDRLVPDIARAAAAKRPAVLRHPQAVRPWQHVLDPLAGYLELAERSWGEPDMAGAWNFGPDAAQETTVREVAERVARPLGVAIEEEPDATSVEAGSLRIDAGKARARLGWRPKLSLQEAAQWTVDWYRAVLAGADALKITLEQIRRHEALAPTP